MHAGKRDDAHADHGRALQGRTRSITLSRTFSIINGFVFCFACVGEEREGEVMQL